MKKFKIWLSRFLIKLGILLQYLGYSLIGFILIFYLYPAIVTALVINTNLHNPLNNDQLGRGTFGDMYGALNAVFSGLALLGIIYTVNEQRKLFKLEKDIEKEKANKLFQDNLHYISALFEEGVRIIENHENAICEFIEQIEPNKVQRIDFKIKSFTNKLSIINDKIDQEKYFLAYRNFFEDFKIIPVFESFGVIQTVCTLSHDHIKLYQDATLNRLNDFADILTKLIEEYNNIYVKIPEEHKNSIDHDFSEILYRLREQKSNILFNLPEYSVIKNLLINIEEKLFQIDKNYVSTEMEKFDMLLNDLLSQFQQFENFNNIIKLELKNILSIISPNKVVINDLNKVLLKQN